MTQKTKLDHSILSILSEEIVTDFDRWKNLPPVQDMARRLKIDFTSLRSWNEFSSGIVRENDRQKGALIKRAKSQLGSLSTGEIPVMLALLHAADFSRIADEQGYEIWQLLSRTHGQHALAVALAIARN